jgi:hypothetical protein
MDSAMGVLVCFIARNVCFHALSSPGHKHNVFTRSFSPRDLKHEVANLARRRLILKVRLRRLCDTGKEALRNFLELFVLDAYRNQVK